MKSADLGDEELVGLIRDHARQSVKEMLAGAEGMETRLGKHEQAVAKLEKVVAPLSDLSVLAVGGAKLMDTITEHVLAQGFNAKIRELRQEFFSKHDFRLSMDKFVKPAELDKLKKEVDQRLQAQKRSITDLSTAEKDAVGGQEDLRALIDDCCSREQLEELQEVVDLKAPQTAIARIDDALQYDYVRAEHQQEFRAELEEQLEDIKDTVAEKAAFSEVEKIQRDLQRQVDKNFEKSALARDCQKDKKELSKQIEKLQNELEKLKKHLKKQERAIDEQALALDAKVDIEEHNDVKELILQLPRVEEVQQLRHYVMSNIETFHADNTTFHEDFKT